LPDWFRSQRSSQLVQDYGFEIIDLVDFFGWRKSDMTTHSHLSCFLKCVSGVNLLGPQRAHGLRVFRGAALRAQAVSIIMGFWANEMFFS